MREYYGAGVLAGFEKTGKGKRGFGLKNLLRLTQITSSKNLVNLALLC